MDIVKILSGVFEGKTLGTPIAILVRNKDARSQDYSEMAQVYRPSHADATYDAKYGIRNWKGGGRSSARETIGRVAAGAIAKKILHQVAGVEVLGYVKRIKDLEGTVDSSTVTLNQIESNIGATYCRGKSGGDRDGAAEIRLKLQHARFGIWRTA